MNTLFSPLLWLAAVLLLSACSFSTSSKSSSTSSNSIADSISGPSLASSKSSESSKQSYDREVSDYTAEFVHSSKGDLDSFRLKIGKLATGSGISNWQEDKATYVAIGKGLRKADLSQSQYESFKKSLSDGEAWKIDAITEGYKK